MSSPVYSPTITVSRNKAGLDTGNEFDVLVSPSRSGVVSFSYTAKDCQFKIRCLDPDGMILRKLGQWDIADWTARHLSQESGSEVGASSLIWDDSLHVRVTDGINPPAVAVGILTGLTHFVDQSDQHVVELIITAEPYSVTRRSDATKGGDYLGANKRFNSGIVKVGTLTRKGGDYGSTESRDVALNDFIFALENLLEVPVRTNTHDCVVVLGDQTIEKLAQRKAAQIVTNTFLGSRALDFDKFITDRLLLNYVVKSDRGEDADLYLMDVNTNVDPDNEHDVRVSKSARGIQYTVQRLQGIALQLGTPEVYTAVTLTEPEMVDLYRDAFQGAFPKFRSQNPMHSVTIIGTADFLSSISTKKGATKVASEQGRAISLIADKVADINDRNLRTASVESLSKLYGEGYVVEFRMNTENPNVTSIVHTQDHSVALNFMQDNFPLKTMLGDEGSLSIEEAEDLTKRFLTLNILNLPVYSDLKKHWEEKYTKSSTDTLARRVTDTLANFVERFPGEEFSAAGLLTYLQYFSTRQLTGNNKLTVRTPPAFNLTGQQFLQVAASFRQALNKTSVTDKRDPVTGENPYSFLNGIYQILDIKHVATDNNAFSEFTIVQIPTEVEPPEMDVETPEPQDVSFKDYERRKTTREWFGEATGYDIGEPDWELRQGGDASYRYDYDR